MDVANQIARTWTADFSLNLETVYYVLSPEYNTYADVQQEINLALFKKFFADPSNSYWRQSQLADYTLGQP